MGHFVQYRFKSGIRHHNNADVAQLAERVIRILGVAGSNPAVSSIDKNNNYQITVDLKEVHNIFFESSSKLHCISYILYCQNEHKKNEHETKEKDNEDIFQNV